MTWKAQLSRLTDFDATNLDGSMATPNDCAIRNASIFLDSMEIAGLCLIHHR